MTCGCAKDFSYVLIHGMACSYACWLLHVLMRILSSLRLQSDSTMIIEILEFIEIYVMLRYKKEGRMEEWKSEEGTSILSTAGFHILLIY